MAEVATRLKHVRQRIAAAEQAAGRAPGSVRLLAASKAQPPERLRAAYEAGLRDVGENYLQEALDKQEALADLPLCWHFIGPIQSNKTRRIAECFDWVHSVDRARILQRLNDQRPADAPPLQICLQINIDGESSKAGTTPELAAELAAAAAALPRLRLRGLMAIPAPQPEPAARRASLAALRHLLERLNADGLQLDTLSMGMSDDLDEAIAEGATIVRIGTAIFGPRPATADGRK